MTGVEQSITFSYKKNDSYLLTYLGKVEWHRIHIIDVFKAIKILHDFPDLPKLAAKSTPAFQTNMESDMHMSEVIGSILPISANVIAPLSVHAASNTPSTSGAPTEASSLSNTRSVIIHADGSLVTTVTDVAGTVISVGTTAASKTQITHADGSVVTTITDPTGTKTFVSTTEASSSKASSAPGSRLSMEA